MNVSIEEKRKIKSKNMQDLSKYRKTLFEKPRLRCLFIELTDRCNLNCRHCGSECDPSKSHYIDTEAVLKLLDELSEDMGNENFMICVTGGEPLLNPDFGRIIRKINECDIPWGMTTNATLIDLPMAQRLKELKMGSVSVSLDGLKEEHEWLRRVTGCYDKTIQGINNLHSVGIDVQVTTVIHKKNMGKLEDIYRFMRELGVRSWRVVNIDPIGRAKENEDLYLSHKEIIQLNEFIREKRFDKDNPMDVCYGCSHYLSFDLEHETRDFYFQCGAGTTIASILCNGDIYGCLDIERRPELVQGNIAADRFSKVWFERFKEYRIDRSELCSDCRNCSEREYCGGDSMHTWDFDKNEPKMCLWRKGRKE